MWAIQCVLDIIIIIGHCQVIILGGYELQKEKHDLCCKLRKNNNHFTYKCNSG